MLWVENNICTVCMIGALRILWFPFCDCDSKLVMLFCCETEWESGGSSGDCLLQTVCRCSLAALLKHTGLQNEACWQDRSVIQYAVCAGKCSLLCILLWNAKWGDWSHWFYVLNYHKGWNDVICAAVQKKANNPLYLSTLCWQIWAQWDAVRPLWNSL